MSCKMSGSCDSDVDVEPVSRLLNVGRPTPLQPASRHIINPNFMFFCQIVLLIIPITVLYAGLYFMNISSNIIIIICGAIVLAILCIFVFVRPFKEEKCAEQKPLRQSYEYTPFKKIDDPAAMGSARPKKTKRHSDEEDAKEEDNDDEESTYAKNVSKDTLLSIATSNFLRIATQPRICTEATPIADMNASARNTAALLEREEKLGNSRLGNKQKWPMEESDGGTWDTKEFSVGADNTTVTKSLGVIEEEGETSRLTSMGPCSENVNLNHTTKLLRPDVALSETTRSSTNRTITELRNTTCSDKTHTQHLSQPSEGRTKPGYNSYESSAYTHHNGKPSLCNSSKQTGPRGSHENFTQACDSDQSNIEHTRDVRHLTCSNTIPLSVCTDQNICHSTHSAGLPPTSANVSQKFGQQFTKRHSVYSYGDHYQSVLKRQEVVCANKLCPFAPRNQIEFNVVPKSPVDPNTSGSNCQRKIPPEKSALPKQNGRRVYMDSSGDEVSCSAHERRDILPISPKKHLNNSPKEPAFQITKFQLCPGDRTPKNDQISSSEFNKTKQPILIKLFPTSSKDGMFLWESNPATKSKIEESMLHPPIQTIDNGLHRTADECVQTTGPGMVDTQTSAVFPGAQNQEQSKFRDSTPAKDKNNTQQQKGAHQTKSGSMVDFVLRPFSKMKPMIRPPRDAKGRMKRSRKVKKNEYSENHKEKEQANQDSSHFDLLRVQPWHKNVDHRTLNSGRNGNTEPKSSNNVGSSSQKERAGKLDICSIYYSSITGKLYQPTRSGLLVTDSSKETVENHQRCAELSKMCNSELHKTSNMKEQTQHNHFQIDKKDRVSTKRKSDENIRSKPKCAKHNECNARKSKPIHGTETMLPWTESPENCKRRQKHDSVLNKLTFMYPPFNLDFSSGPSDEITMGSSDLIRNKETKDNKTLATPKIMSKKPQSSEVQRQSKHNNRRISHKIETTLFKKSSSSYENVVIEKVVKQKKRTMKKFK